MRVFVTGGTGFIGSRMAIDQMLTMKHALPADASKSARELCLTYTPIRTAIEQVVARQRTR